MTFFHGYIRFPTIFDDTIVFTAKDEIWRVAASGGRAERLTAAVSAAFQARVFHPMARRLPSTRAMKALRKSISFPQPAVPPRD